MDVTDPASIRKGATELDGQAIDLLLNNAGIIGARARPSETLTTRPGQRCSPSTPWAPAGVRGVCQHVASSDRKLIVTLTSGMGSIADNTSGGSIVYRSQKRQ